MLRLTLRDASSLVFEAKSLTNSGKALGIVWKFFQTTHAAFPLFVPHSTMPVYYHWPGESYLWKRTPTVARDCPYEDDSHISKYF